MGLRAIRKKRGLTQQQLADQAGLAQSYISALEVSKRPDVGWSVVQRLAKVLRVKPHELFDVTDREVRP